MKIRTFLVLSVILSIATQALAWGTKEHVILTKLAVLRLLEDPSTPQGLKDFLTSSSTDLPDVAACREMFMTTYLGAEPKGLTGLSKWVVEPDIRANGEKKKLIGPYGQNEFQMHFLDLEYLNTEKSKRVYKDDLSSLGDVKTFPRDFKDERYKESGLLPFSLQRSYDKLVECFKSGKLQPDANDPSNEDNALRWAGFLSHYAEDNLQPLHSTQDYKCASYFADRRKAPNVHAQIEYSMNDLEPGKAPQFPELRTQFWELLMHELKTVKSPITVSNDPWLETLLVCEYSYKQIPLIGRAAMFAASQKGTPDKPEGPAGEFDTVKFFQFAEANSPEKTVMKMKAHQQAIAVVRVAELLRRAWDESHPAK